MYQFYILITKDMITQKFPNYYDLIKKEDSDINSFAYLTRLFIPNCSSLVFTKLY